MVFEFIRKRLLEQQGIKYIGIEVNIQIITYRCGRHHILVRFIFTYALSSYNHKSCQFDFRLCRDVLYVTKVCL